MLGPYHWKCPPYNLAKQRFHGPYSKRKRYHHHSGDDSSGTTPFRSVNDVAAPQPLQAKVVGAAKSVKQAASNTFHHSKQGANNTQVRLCAGLRFKVCAESRLLLCLQRHKCTACAPLRQLLGVRLTTGLHGAGVYVQIEKQPRNLCQWERSHLRLLRVSTWKAVVRKDVMEIHAFVLMHWLTQVTLLMAKHRGGMPWGLLKGLTTNLHLPGTTW